MTKQQEYAAARKCILCDESCDGSVMHFHHDSMQTCILILQKQRDAANERAAQFEADARALAWWIGDDPRLTDKGRELVEKYLKAKV